MVVKVYISGISGNKEVKKRQQRVILILESKNIKYELLDIAEPNMEEAKEYMQNNSKLMGGTIGDPNPRHPLPPQIFNDDEYCGDYDAFDLANENDEMEKFLKLAPEEITSNVTSNADVKIGNGEVSSEGKSKEASPEKQTSEVASSDVQENGEEGNEGVMAEEKSSNNQKEKSPSPEKDAEIVDYAAKRLPLTCKNRGSTLDSCLNRADLIRVYDGKTSSDPAIRVLCNEGTELEVLSTGSELFIEFIANSDSPGQGFKARYQFQMMEESNSIDNVKPNRLGSFLFPTETGPSVSETQNFDHTIEACHGSSYSGPLFRLREFTFRRQERAFGSG